MGRYRRLWIVCAWLAVLLVGVKVGLNLTREPTYVEILAVRRAPANAIPASTRLRDESVVPLALTVRRTDLALLARHDATFVLVQFSCENRGRQFYGSEIYLDGSILRQFNHGGPVNEELTGRQSALLWREAVARDKGEVATLIAVIPRPYAEGRGDDMEGAPCLQLVTGLDYGEVEKGVARIPPAF